MFCEIIKNSRVSADLTLKEVAHHLGISVGYLCDLEQGRALRPKMRVLYAMAGLYGLSIDELCIAAERIPQDVFYKIVKNPDLLIIVRNWSAKP